MKKIVLLTAANFSRSSTGTSQTLENLFDGYPKDELMICSPDPASGTFASFDNIGYETPLFNNRILRRLLPKKITALYFKKIKTPVIARRIIKFKPDLLVIANVDYHPAFITNHVIKKLPVPLCVYLLDDLINSPDESINNLFHGLMKKANSHVFISNYMAEANMARFAAIKHWMVVHNPVAENEIAGQVSVQMGKQDVSIAYAGSIWPMHSDALLAFAAAIAVLRKNGMRIRLVVYTTKSFYESFREQFTKLDITYGGFIPFAELKPLLLQYDGLLVASSFDKEMRLLSSYSVQTKITDYIACGVPVISIGPEYAACNRFIEENKIGYCIKTNDPSAIASSLQSFLSEDRAEVKVMAENGLKLVREKYKKSKIQNTFFEFLNKCR